MRIDRSKQCRALAHVGAGDAYTQLGRYDEALRENQQALALDVRPTSGTAAANMSFLYTAMGRYDEAAAMYQRARQLCGSLTHAAVPDLCQALIFAGQGQYEAAVAIAQGALRKAFASGEIKAAANAVLGYSLAMVSDFAGATAACEKAVKAKHAAPWAAMAENAMGIMWSSSGHWQEALEHFRKAVALVDADAEPHLRAAQGYAMLGEWDKAEESLKAARDRAPLSRYAPIAARLLEQSKETWQMTQLPMPRPPAYPAPPQYTPPGYPYGQTTGW
jgi:tetratricopeptide (TPR) repeat protein